jgi:phosphate starvation-inducible membrane PsiE
MKYKFKIASILAFILGCMSIIAGSKVLLGIDTKTYNVINWLVIYNVIFGFISIIASYFIWSKHQLAKKGVIIILVSHSLILSYIYLFSVNVASESIKAMLFRVVVLLLIFIITINQKINLK